MSFSEKKLCQMTGAAINADEATGDADTVDVGAHRGDVLEQLVRVDPLADRARVSQDRAVGQLQRRQLFLTGRLTQLGTRAFALPRPRAAASGDHLVVLDLRSAEGLLHAAARMHPRAAIVAVADEERRLLGGDLSHGAVETSEGGSAA